MKLYVVFAQRHCRYEGEFAPEAVEVMDEWAYDENPVWIEDKAQEARDTGEFSGVEIIAVNIGKKGLEAIDERLRRTPLEIEGDVVVD